MADRSPTQTLTVAETSPEAIADEWCTLLAVCQHAYPFQHPAWHAAWWRTFGDGRAPVLLSVRDGDRLVGVAPLMRDGDHLLLAGDHEICDYMDVLVAPEMAETVYERLLAGLADLSWRELVLWGLPEHSRTLALLPKLAERRGWQAAEEFEAVCPRVPLTGSWEAYLASLTKKDRHELRRKMRRFRAAGEEMTLRSFSAPAEVRAGLDDFIHLHTISRHDKREFMTPQMESFFRTVAVALAEQELVRLFFVELDRRRVAGLLAFDTGDELLLYNSGYDPALAHASVGIVSKALALQAAVAAGKTCFDFLRGAEPYKYDLGARDLEVHTLTVKREI